MFKRLLIANRGEIACRIMRTAQGLGIETVAVYSTIDRDLPHVLLADHAVEIGPPPATESYLNSAAIIAAARQTKADAVHPGYGFLSENAEFARRCAAESLTFVGPSATAIEAMGSKAHAKQLMAAANVPLLPGYHGDEQAPATLKSAAADCGYPVLIKASAGGGGKGMRIVQSAAEFDEALQAARREALNAFGDDRVIIEKYLQQPRHIEVQIFADQHGNTVHLFDRDCSVQRRYQKIVEEAPAPNLSVDKREQLHAAAKRAAQAIDYSNAGTVEFIADANGDCYFMEMNTRLQVEHPVTEMVTGLDLVEWQLRVAAGETLPLAQEQIECHGHAIEARVYAETPAQHFLPSSGRLEYCEFPATEVGIRVDTGFAATNEIATHYDPMVAKVMAHAADRETARRQLQRALGRTAIAGINTNSDFLMKVVAHPLFVASQYTTRFVDDHIDSLLVRTPDEACDLLAITAYYLQGNGWDDDQNRNQAHSPWNRGDSWRLNTQARNRYHLRLDQTLHNVATEQTGDRLTVQIDQCSRPIRRGQAVDGWLTYWFDSRQVTAKLLRQGDQLALFTSLGHASIGIEIPQRDHSGEHTRQNQVLAPVPGRVVAIAISEGSAVKAGDALLIMEAMKMEHTLSAPCDGVIGQIHCSENASVSADQVLIEIDAGADA